MARTLPANLVMFQPRGALSFLGTRPEHGAARRRGNRILGHDDLLDRLEVLGELAPAAPLSFLLVRVCAEDAPARGVAAAVAERVGSLVRATDVVGLFGQDGVGVVLQGTGVTAAGAVAGRLSLHLNRALADMAPGHHATVHAATGTGLNALTLPIAATQDLDDIC